MNPKQSMFHNKLIGIEILKGGFTCPVDIRHRIARALSIEIKPGTLHYTLRFLKQT